MNPFSIKIFLPDGDPDGLRIIEKSNWTGVGVVFNRSIYQDSRKRQEFDRTGVYILVGTSEDSTLPMVYIGEGDPVKPRIESHYSKKDFWTWAIFFTAKDETLNKAHVKYLESRLIELANKAKLCIVENGKDSSLPNLAEAEQADIECFLLDMLSIFPLVNLPVFEQAEKNSKPPNDLLHISAPAKGLSGTGYESPKGFVVCKGTQVCKTEVKSIHNYMSVMRRDLLLQGVIEESDVWTFTQDYIFNSPSTAAGVILGRTANGRIEWKNKSGKTLKKIQQEHI